VQNAEAFSQRNVVHIAEVTDSVAETTRGNSQSVIKSAAEIKTLANEYVRMYLHVARSLHHLESLLMVR
jgi:uncharacterized membrane-anchored protein YhcB (DUF1043 family)